MTFNLALCRLLALLPFAVISFAEAETISYRDSGSNLIFQIHDLLGPPESYRIELISIADGTHFSTITGFYTSTAPTIAQAIWTAPTNADLILDPTLFRGTNEIPLSRKLIDGKERYKIAFGNIDLIDKSAKFTTGQPVLARVSASLMSGMPICQIKPWSFYSGAPTTIPWTGWDPDGFVNYLNRPGLVVMVQCIELAPDTIVLGSPPYEKYAWYPGYSSARLAQVHYDFDVAALTTEYKSVPPFGAAGITNVPVVRPSTSIRIDLTDETLGKLGASRFEIIFYLNGTYYREEPEGSSPYTFLIPSNQGLNGLNYITIYLVDYAGNEGLKTIALWLES